MRPVMTTTIAWTTIRFTQMISTAQVPNKSDLLVRKTGCAGAARVRTESASLAYLAFEARATGAVDHRAAEPPFQTVNTPVAWKVTSLSATIIALELRRSERLVGRTGCALVAFVLRDSVSTRETSARLVTTTTNA